MKRFVGGSLANTSWRSAAAQQHMLEIIRKIILLKSRQNDWNISERQTRTSDTLAAVVRVLFDEAVGADPLLVECIREDRLRQLSDPLLEDARDYVRILVRELHVLQPAGQEGVQTRRDWWEITE
jgi:hypothetical protein